MEKMSRKKKEINPIIAERLRKLRAERLRKLIKREGISQIKLASLINRSQQNISKVINLKATLTEDNAQFIISAFPEYRIEWLLGYDDVMLKKDYFAKTLKKAQGESEIMEQALFGLAALSGFAINPTNPAPDRSVENILQAVKGGITFSRDGKNASMSLTELNDFENELCDYVEMRLKRMLK